MTDKVTAINHNVAKGNSLVQAFEAAAEGLINNIPIPALTEQDPEVRLNGFKSIAENTVKNLSGTKSQKDRFRDATVSILVHMAGVLDSQKEMLDFEDTGAIRKTLGSQKQAIVGALVEAAITEKMLPPVYRR